MHSYPSGLPGGADALRVGELPVRRMPERRGFHGNGSENGRRPDRDRKRNALYGKRHPRAEVNRIADSIRDSHILSTTIQEYSFTLFNLKVAVSGVVARAYDDHVGQVGDVNRVMLPTDMLSHWR